MENDLINILSNSNKDIDNQKLMDYLSDKLSGDEKHEIEKLMADSPLINDAVEGLQQFENKKDLLAYVTQLNADLQKQIQKKAQRKQKRKLREQPWLYLTIIVILLLIVVAFVVIRKFLAA
jgi:competence CoiA-like predicted nuclease